MYDAVTDPYCYAGTSVLKNLRNIRNGRKLERFENAMAEQRADEPPPEGRLSVSHYRTIHRHLFQDVYAWAGKFRTVRIAKGGNAFCYPEHIPREMRMLFSSLKAEHHFARTHRSEFVAKAGSFLATLNAIHPFREGNGRTQLSFVTLLAERAGHPFAVERLRPRRFLDAMIASFSGKEGPLMRELAVLAGLK